MSIADDVGLWIERCGTKRFDGRPALFLDRDGVIVEEVHFLRHIKDVRLIAGTAEAVVAANSQDIAVVIVTNQSGIARGLYSWVDFERVQSVITAQLAGHGASVDLVLACGYHRDRLGALGREHPWRKPAPGMLLEAQAILGIDLSRSLVVGDRASDIGAGKAAGLRQGALVDTGYGADEWKRNKEMFARWEAHDQFTTISAATAGDAIHGWLDAVGRYKPGWGARIRT